ncbi:transposase-like protein [Paraburkholderia sp. JPY465]|uniref:hypothetical protein n=2 Tax=Paraburkholderia sp. JPY465 TaxID=3042285 RepID=UPI003D1A1800
MTQNTQSGVGRLSDDKRKAIALQALTRTEPISVLAERNGVSRPTVYRQIGTASVALDEAFDTTRAADADQVLFMLPVTRQWLDQVIVALTMVGHVSFRSTLELMHDLLGVSTSLGTIHTVLQRAAKQAIAINAGIDLSPIRVGLHDELFQGSQPVLAGIDVASTYCYLLAPEAHRDGDTWAIHLLDLQAQGLDPEHTIADAGTGLRAGQKMAWPDTPCHGDVFHIIQQGKSLATLWHRVASGARTGREQLEARLANPRRRGEDSLLEAALETLRRNEAHAHELAADLRTLVQWLERDILSLAGPDLATRQRLFDFVVAELQQREARDLSRTGAYRRALQNQRDGLLAFAGLLDTKLDAIARTHNVARHLVREVCMLHRKSETSSAFWQGWNRLLARIGRPFHGVYAAVSGALHSTPRSSSLVENLNSRLRVYLTNRRHLKGGRAWLGLLQFVFNHRRFARSRCPERTGKSPRELMSRKPHDHWLTLLGFGPLQPQRT